MATHVIISPKLGNVKALFLQGTSMTCLACLLQIHGMPLDLVRLDGSLSVGCN